MCLMLYLELYKSFKEVILIFFFDLGNVDQQFELKVNLNFFNRNRFIFKKNDRNLIGFIDDGIENFNNLSIFD